MTGKKKNKKGKSIVANRPGYEKNIFNMNFNNTGPQNQLVYTLRFPVSYKNNQLISERVNFTNYFDWMGQIREYSLRPIMNKISELIEGGKWGLATNSAKIKIFDLLSADDVLEGRLWLNKISGHDNIYHLSFDWLRFLNVNSYERVAYSSLIVSCVEIIGHGQAVITRPPDFIKKFFDNMRPQVAKKSPLKKYKTLFENINLGVKIKDFTDKPRYIFRNNFQTSLENSNLVGNIYFANYSKWINSTKDLYLYSKMPDLFYKTKFHGEFVTVECTISYLQEAMPFDKIFVRMFLVTIYEKGIVLRYEVSKFDKVRKKNKLAIVTQTIVFVEYDKSIPTIKKITRSMLNYFLK